MATKKDFLDLQQSLDAYKDTLKSIQEGSRKYLGKITVDSEKEPLSYYIGGIISTITAASTYIDTLLSSVENMPENKEVNLSGSLDIYNEQLTLGCSKLLKSKDLITDSIHSYQERLYKEYLNVDVLDENTKKNLDTNFEKMANFIYTVNPKLNPVKLEEKEDLNSSLGSIDIKNETIEKKHNPAADAKTRIDLCFINGNKNEIKDINGIYKLLKSLKSPNWNSGVYNDLVKNAKKLGDLTKNSKNLDEPTSEQKKYYNKVMDGIKAYKELSQEKLSSFSNAEYRTLKAYAVEKIEDYLKSNFEDLQDSYEKTKTVEEQTKVKANETPGATLS